MNQLPADGDILSLFPNLNITVNEASDSTRELDNLIDASCYPNMPALEMSSLIRRNIERANSDANTEDDNDFDLREWPNIESTPINEFTTEGFICMAFPTLFTYGIGDLNSRR